MDLVLDRLHWEPLWLGVLIWALLVLLIWWPRPPKPPVNLLEAYDEWKRSNGFSRASFHDFMAGGSAPGMPPSRWDLTIALTAFALLVLLGAMTRWGVIG